MPQTLKKVCGGGGWVLGGGWMKVILVLSLRLKINNSCLK